MSSCRKAKLLKLRAFNAQKCAEPVERLHSCATKPMSFIFGEIKFRRKVLKIMRKVLEKTACGLVCAGTRQSCGALGEQGIVI